MLKGEGLFDSTWTYTGDVDARTERWENLEHGWLNLVDKETGEVVEV